MDDYRIYATSTVNLGIYWCAVLLSKDHIEDEWENETLAIFHYDRLSAVEEAIKWADEQEIEYVERY